MYIQFSSDILIYTIEINRKALLKSNHWKCLFSMFHCIDLHNKDTKTLFCTSTRCTRIFPLGHRVRFEDKVFAWQYHILQPKIFLMKQSCINLNISISIERLPLSRLFRSIILPHHPDTQGIVSTPFSILIAVVFIVKGSLHDPNSPLDLQLTHLRRIPTMKSNTFTCTYISKLFV